MKVLLLGSNGQLGTDVMSANARRTRPFELVALRRQGLDVSAIDRIEPTLHSHDFDVLINCTSYHKTDEVEANAGLAFTINAHAVEAMAEACRAKNAKLVHISTDYVFCGNDQRPYVETDGAGPINVYGASKLMGETLARLAHDNICVLRVASLFGVASPSGKGGNFVETMLRVAREKGEVRVVGDIVMSPTATADVADMIFAILDKEAGPGLYHAVNTGSATWCEFAREIIQQAGIDATVTPISSDEYPTAARRPAYSVLDNAKMASVTGPIPTWEDALERYLVAKGHVTAESEALL